MVLLKSMSKLVLNVRIISNEILSFLRGWKIYAKMNIDGEPIYLNKQSSLLE